MIISQRREQMSKTWVSNLIFVHLVSKHRKAGSQNLLGGKIFRTKLYSMSPSLFSCCC